MNKIRIIEGMKKMTDHHLEMIKEQAINFIRCGKHENNIAVKVFVNRYNMYHVSLCQECYDEFLSIEDKYEHKEIEICHTCNGSIKSAKYINKNKKLINVRAGCSNINVCNTHDGIFICHECKQEFQVSK